MTKPNKKPRSSSAPNQENAKTPNIRMARKRTRPTSSPTKAQDKSSKLIADTPSKRTSQETDATAQTNEESRQDYDVGYGKPPKEHQFKPGQSGNKNGRPKNSKNVSTIVRNEIEELVVVKENGKARKIPKLQAIIKLASEKALRGDARATKMLVDLWMKLDRETVPETDETSRESEDEDFNILKRFGIVPDNDDSGDQQ